MRKISRTARFAMAIASFPAAASLAVIAAIILLTHANPPTAWAQAPGCASIPIYSLGNQGNFAGRDSIINGYHGYSNWLKASCAMGTFTASAQGGPTVPVSANYGGNPSGPRSDVIAIDPCTLPGGSDLPDAKLTVTFTNPTETETITAALAPDKDKPTLKTTSTPPKGTRVKAGDTIKVRMEASEEYTTARGGWQTGIKKIQLTNESPNQVVPPHFESSGPPRPCQQKQWKQFLEVTYTVPPNPPPVIRLRAVAEDFAGNKDYDLGEFPTGDPLGALWIGSLQAVQLSGKHMMTTEVKVRLREVRLYKLPSMLAKGVGDMVVLEDAGSLMTRRSSTDTRRVQSCTYSGQGTATIMSPAGEIISTVEEIGPGGKPRWSTPVYQVSMAFGVFVYDVIEVCQMGSGARTMKRPGGDKGSYAAQTAADGGRQRHRPLEDGRMVGSWSDDREVVSWSICREGVACPALPPLSVPSPAAAAPK